MNKCEDIIKFYRTIGAYDELGERGFEISEIYGDVEAYENDLKKLLLKYDISYNSCGSLHDDILNMEEVIDEKFRELLKKL